MNQLHMPSHFVANVQKSLIVFLACSTLIVPSSFRYFTSFKLFSSIFWPGHHFCFVFFIIILESPGKTGLFLLIQLKVQRQSLVTLMSAKYFLFNEYLRKVSFLQGSPVYWTLPWVWILPLQFLTSLL